MIFRSVAPVGQLRSHSSRRASDLAHVGVPFSLRWWQVLGVWGLFGLLLQAATFAQEPVAELVFPLNAEHNHAPGIVECPNGDLLVSWYRGAGERKADDVRVLGARKKKGSSQWSPDFLMADTPGFPDCNTCMMIDAKQRLRLFWPIIIANSWESCLTQVATSANYQSDAPPTWSSQQTIWLRPDDFSAEIESKLAAFLQATQLKLNDEMQKEIDAIKERTKDRLYQRLGWQPRCKPTTLRSGRILLPLYSDTYSASLMAISDDGGDSWRASKLLIGFGNIQPIVLERKDGSLVAYMRENGITGHVRVCESHDAGESWGEVTSSELPNPGSGLDAVALQSGAWVMIYNDQAKDRTSLAVSLSDDEGKSWKVTRRLEDTPGSSFHYPAIIQGKDGTIHAIYSYFVPGGKSMKHVAFTEKWLRSSAK